LNWFVVIDSLSHVYIGEQCVKAEIFCYTFTFCFCLEPYSASCTAV